jgi:hypothetical protein
VKIAVALLFLIASSIAHAAHFDITLTANSSDGASREAFADQSPPIGGLNSRPVLKIRAGEIIRFQFLLTNVYDHGVFRDAGVHYFIVLERAAGQRTIPPLKNAVVEGSFTIDLKPKARIGVKQQVALSQPGVYLLRVESLHTQRDHEHFAAIDLEVQ